METLTLRVGSLISYAFRRRAAGFHIRWPKHFELKLSLSSRYSVVKPGGKIILTTGLKKPSDFKHFINIWLETSQKYLKVREAFLVLLQTCRQTLNVNKYVDSI